MNRNKTIAVPQTYFEQLQPRDSILIADQMLFGADMPGVPAGTTLELPQFSLDSEEGIQIVQSWKTDTLEISRKLGLQHLRSTVKITSFDEGEYVLPAFNVIRHLPDGSCDTLAFEGKDIFVCSMPVDTATFEIHPIKGQMQYPVTFREVAPWLGVSLAFACLVAAVVYVIRKYRKKQDELQYADPPHIVALRKLDSYRGDKYWEASKQKQFYSGVTDALREYIAARYAVNAMEMTTAQMLAAMKDCDVPEDLMAELKALFERSDYVKFAKHVASEQENASVLPFSVKFVTSTYQQEIKEESNVL